MRLPLMETATAGNSNFTEIKQFKLMFETHRGVVEGDTDVVYLRPETAQGEYVNFLNIQRSMRAKVPFGIVFNNSLFALVILTSPTSTGSA